MPYVARSHQQGVNTPNPAALMISVAKDTARNNGFVCARPDHLLVSLGKDKVGIAGEVLRSEALAFEQMMVVAPKFWKNNPEELRRRKTEGTAGQVRLSKVTEKIIRQSQSAASKLDQALTSGHILLMTLSAPEGTLAIDLLETLDADPSILRTKTLQMLNITMKQWTQILSELVHA